MFQFFKPKCPYCKKRALENVQFIRATVVVDGKRVPDSWAYYQCKNCGARYKYYQESWTPALDKEWNRDVQGNSPKAV